MTFGKPVWSDVLLVLCGGALGSLLRYVSAVMFRFETSSPFPWHTFLVNIVGCFLIGFCAMRLPVTTSPGYRLFFITGFLGAFTTFSTFSYETVQLFQNGHLRTALFNLFASTITGLCAVGCGVWLGISGLPKL